MALRDLGLEIKLGAKNTGRGTMNAARRLKPVQASAISAARYSNMEARTAMDPDNLSLELLKLIDNATKKGKYITATRVPPGSMQKVAAYFTNKGFIVATNNKKTALCICWIGGTTWRKWNYGNTKTDKVTKEQLQDEIQSVVSEALSKVDEKAPNVVWINPKRISPANLAKIWGKLK